MPETEKLSTASITQLLQDRNTSQNTLLVHRKIRYPSFTELLDKRINILAHHDDAPPDFTNTQPQQSVPTHATPATQPRSAIHHRHPIINNLIRRPPPTHTDLPADTRQFNQTSVFEPCALCLLKKRDSTSVRLHTCP